MNGGNEMNWYKVLRVSAVLAVLVFGERTNGWASSVPPLNYDELLLAEGYEATTEGLSSALASTNASATVWAIAVIKQKNLVPQFAGQLHKLLNHDDIWFRVEAAIALGSIGNAEALKILIAVTSVPPSPGFENVLTWEKCRAAEVLADLGMTNGWSFIEAAFRRPKRDTDKSTVAIVLRKFARFRGQGIDVVPLLVDGLTRELDQAEKEAGQKPHNCYLIHVILSTLKAVGDERALPVLRRAALSKDWITTSMSEGACNAIHERKKHRPDSKDKPEGNSESRQLPDDQLRR